MVWQIAALALTLLGALLLYLSNKHQIITARPIHKFWRYVALLCWVCSLGAWLQTLVTSAAILIWLISMMAIQIIVPLLSLSKPSKTLT